MSEALRRPIRRDPRLGHAVGRTASSASVLSPFMAANATFALKPGEWFLRVRFVILVPDSRREASPPPGRKSSQPTVQILEATSAAHGILTSNFV